MNGISNESNTSKQSSNANISNSNNNNNMYKGKPSSSSSSSATTSEKTITTTTTGGSESLRIYWQQCNENNNTTTNENSRRDLITSSAAIRISRDGATAKDVTDLLRNALKLNTNNEEGDNDKAYDYKDALVLVGTLYSLPANYVQFHHEIKKMDPPRQSQAAAAATTPAPINPPPPFQRKQSNRSSDPFHVIKTLKPTDNPLAERDDMLQELKERLQTEGANTNTNTTIKPSFQWYYVPGKKKPKRRQHQYLIPSCYIELDGYTTPLEESDDEDDGFSDTDNDDNILNTSSLDKNENAFMEGEESHYNDEECNDKEINDEESDPKEGFTSSSHELCHPKNNDTTTTTATTPEEEKNPAHAANQQQKHLKAIVKKIRQRIRVERERQYELSLYQSSLRYHCVSGYLLKQSKVDKYVWRLVHCILTDDHLWYVSRVYNFNDSNYGNSNNSTPTTTKSSTTCTHYKYSKHKRIRLTRAFLVQQQPGSNEHTSPTMYYRTPFAFEVVSSKGTSHVFRAMNRKIQHQWIEALGYRIQQSYENSLLEHADLIVTDETQARNQRFTNLTVQPLWDAYIQSQRTIAGGNHYPVQPLHLFSTATTSTTAAATITSDTASNVTSATTTYKNPMKKILMLGMEISDYREQCRHIQAILPAKQPVVIYTEMSSVPDTIMNVDQQIQHRKQQQLLLEAKLNEEQEAAAAAAKNGGRNELLLLDKNTKDMIANAWEIATKLLSKVSQVAMDLQQQQQQQELSSTLMEITPTRRRKLPCSLETLCRHIDYVITGSLKSFQQNTDYNGSPGNALPPKAGERRVVIPQALGKGTSSSPSNIHNDKITTNGASGSGQKNNLQQQYQKQLQDRQLQLLRQDPPPIDLFDLILAELQVVASSIIVTRQAKQKLQQQYQEQSIQSQPIDKYLLVSSLASSNSELSLATPTSTSSKQQ